MAEAIALGASVIAFIQLTESVIKICKGLMEKAKDAPTDLRYVLAEATSLKAILENLQFLRGIDSHYDNLPYNIQTSMVACRNAVEGLEEGLQRMDIGESYDDHRDSKKRKIKTSLKWALGGADNAKKMLQVLQQHKSTIDLALTVENM